MFDNIGGKIKTLAKIICWIGIIASVISGIALMASGANRYYSGPGPVLLGILTIVFGSLASWIGSFFTYGFGQLIENTDEIRGKKSSTQFEPHTEMSFTKTTTPVIPTDGWKCSCGRVNYAYITTCACGKSKWDVTKEMTANKEP